MAGGLTFTGFSPTSGPAGAQTTVVLSGSGFLSETVLSVTFRASLATNLVVNSDNEMVCKTPALSQGDADVVCNTDAASYLVGTYTYTPAVSIPNTGRAIVEFEGGR